MNLKFYKEQAEKAPEDFELFHGIIFPFVMKWEGGGKLHKVKGDRGGWTIWGIAYNFNKHLFSGFEDFRDTTREEASYIAFTKYYLAARADKVPHECKLYYFDMAYNMGVSRAVKTLQKAVGVKADGIIGRITLSRFGALKEADLKRIRESRYYWLATKYYRLKKFLKGWLNRSRSVYSYRY